MARAGRKRKTNVRRDETGKSRGEIVDLTPMFEQPHRRDLAEPWVKEAGYPLGRLRMNGLIDQHQFSAGNAYAGVVYSYARTMGIPMGSPRSGSMSEYISGSFYNWESDGQTSEEAEKRVQEVKSRYNECHVALTKLGRIYNRSNKILIVLREICIQEVEERAVWADPARMSDLRLGLNAVWKILLDTRG